MEKQNDLSLPPSSKGHKLYIRISEYQNLKRYPPAVSVILNEQSLEIIPEHRLNCSGYYRRYLDSSSPAAQSGDTVAMLRLEMDEMLVSSIWQS